jgi:VCBS repeat-containing protein
MADSNTNKNTTVAEDDNVDNQQALDDLTVLANVAEQTLGQAGLNVVRQTDVSTSELGRLAEIIPGSAGDHAPAEKLGVTTGLQNIEIDTVTVTNNTGNIDTIQVETVGSFSGETITASGPTINIPQTQSGVTQTREEQPTGSVADIQFTGIQQTQTTNVGPATYQGVAATETTTYTAAATETTQDIKVNHAPIIDSQTDGTTETDHTGATGRITAHDPDGDTFSFHLIDPVTGAQVDTITTENGSVTINPATGEYTFTPNAEQSHLGVGETSLSGFKAVATDSNGATSSPIDVKVTVTGSNDAPVVSSETNISATDHEGGSGSMTASDLDANDTRTYHFQDANGNLVDSVATEHGTVTINPTTGEYTFTPNAGAVALAQGETATDSIKVVAQDNHGAVSEPATVNINLTGTNDAPTISSTHDVTTATDHTAISGNMTGADVDNNTTVSYHLQDSNGNLVDTITTENGSVTINPVTGEYTFTPNAEQASLGLGQSAQDSFKVVAQDENGATSEPSTVNVTITGSNDGPVITQTSDALSTDHSMTSSGSVTASDIDANDTLTYHINGGTDLGNGTESLVTDHGTVILNNTTGEYTFTPNADSASLAVGATAKDSFTVTVNDTHGGSTTAVTAVDLVGTNDGPTITTSDITTANDHTGISGTASSTDVDHNATSTYHLQDANGNLVDSLTTEYGTVTIDATTGEYTFTPNAEQTSLGVGQSAQDSFTVQVSDGQGGAASSTVNLTITGSNDGPVVTEINDMSTTDVGTTTGQVTGSDTDTNDTLSYHFQDANGNLVDTLTTEHGTVTIDPTTGEYTFTASSSDKPMGVGDSVTDSFKVVAQDNNGTISEPSTVNVTINGTNDGPTVTLLGGTGNEDTVIQGTVIGADINTGDTLNYHAPGGVADGQGNELINTEHGSVILNTSTGEYTFTPNANWSGNDAFSVTVSDGQGGTVTQAVNLNVGAVADAPELSLSLGGSSFVTLPDVSTNVTINSSNMMAGDSGFSVSAVNLNGSTGTLSTGQYGFGVSGNASGAAQELGQSGGRSEKIVVDFDNDVSTANVSFGWLASNEKAHYDLYKDGVKVGEGTVTGKTDRVDPSISVKPTDGDSFDQIVFSAPSGGDNDFLINSIKFQNVEPGAHVVDYPLNVAANLTDTDGSERLAVNLNGLPEGAVIVDTLGHVVGTDMGNGAWSLPSGQLDGLTLRVPDDGEAFTLGATATSTESSNQAAASTSVSLAVEPPNHAPTIDEATLTTQNDHTAITGHAVVHDVDAGDTISYHLVDADGNQTDTLATEYGTVTINPVTGEYTFTPNADAQALNNGVVANDSFTIQVSDGQGGTATSTIPVTITGDNEVATMSGQITGTVTEDGTLKASGTIQVHDVDTGEAHTVASIQSGDHGDFTVDASGAWSYNLNNSDASVQSLGAGETLTETFRVYSDDGSSFEDVKVSIMGTNDAPVTTSFSYTTNEDSTITIKTSDILSHSTDVDSSNLTVTGLTSSSGTLVDNNDGTWTLTPNENFNGQIDMSYTVSDGELTSTNHIDVNVLAVNDGPTTSTVNLNGTEDTTIVITQNQLLANATDVDGNQLSVANLSSNNGTLVDNQDGTWSFTPSQDFNGTVNLTYQVSDGTASVAGGAIVNVGAVNDTPVTTSFGYTTNEDGTLTIKATDILSHSSDVDNTNLSVTGLSSTSGTLVDNHDGTWTLTPNENFNGRIDMSYTVSDGELTSTNHIDVNVLAVNDGPTTTNVSLSSGVEDTSVTISKSSLLANATDVDGDTLSTASISASHGTIVDNGNGTITFTPDANYNGNVNFTYTISDGHGGTTSGTASMNIAAVNDGPTTSTVNLNGTEDTTITITQNQLLANATDIDGNQLSVSNLSSGNGTLVDNHNGTWSFTPSQDFNGTVNLTYQVSDGTASVAGGAIVNVGAVNDAPVTTSFGYTMNEDGTLTIRATDILSHSSDVDSANLTVTGLTTTAGSLVDNNNGTWTLTPTHDFNGHIDMSFTISDGQLTSTNHIDVNVLPVDDKIEAPTIDNFIDKKGDLKHVTMEGTGNQAGDTIKIYDEDNRLVGTTTVGEDNTWSLDVSNLKYTGNNDNEFFHATETYQDGSVSDSSEVTHYWHGDWSNAETESSDDFAMMGSGNDTVYVNDDDLNDHVVIDGGSGTDKAIFNFKSSDVEFDREDDGSFIITESNGDINEIRNFENFQFNDTTLTSKDIDKLIDDIPQGNSSGGSHGGSHGGSSGGSHGGWGKSGGGWNDSHGMELTGTNGRDNISGGSNDDYIDGGKGKDTLWGGAGNDELHGGKGNDTLWGGSGSDDMYGDTGNDLFMFGKDSGDGSGWHDFIDGGKGHDTIDLTSLGHDWVLTVDGHEVDHAAHGTVNFDKGDEVTIHVNDGHDSTITFENIEQLKF